LAGLGWSVAAVYSAIVLATGPTVVTPLVKQIRLASPLSDVLEAEGLVLEPIGAVLALKGEARRICFTNGVTTVGPVAKTIAL
jgi:NhaP-type Na+/H+ or K+/H+ antiporter